MILPRSRLRNEERPNEEPMLREFHHAAVLDPGVSEISISSPTSEQGSRDTILREAYGSYSACCASLIPTTFLANAITIC